MIEREISPFILKLAENYPIVTVMGPRQSGKTTLVRHLFPNYEYINLEDPGVREEISFDVRGFLQRHPSPVIFDEIQRVPDLTSYLQTIVDQAQKPGMYVLTGSHQPVLRATVSQSLAGRTGIVDLLPLSVRELKGAGYEKTRDEWMFDGFMPRLTAMNISPAQLYGDYYLTYIERDAHQLINIQDSGAFERFIHLLAGRVGQAINFTSLANDVGMSVVTLKKWLSVLEASFIVFTLHPYYENFGKRLIKAPKIYFTEPGLVAYLLGIETASQIARDPLVGGMFENFVVCELLKARLNAGKRPNLYYFRDSKGMEVDVLLDEGRMLRPFEIKSSSTMNADFVKSLLKFKAIVPNVVSPTVIYAGKDLPSIEKPSFLNFENIASAVCEG